MFDSVYAKHLDELYFGASMLLTIGPKIVFVLCNLDNPYILVA